MIVFAEFSLIRNFVNLQQLRFLILVFSHFSLFNPIQANSGSEQLRPFLESLISSSRFSQCTLLFFQDGEADNSKFLSQILSTKSEINYYNVKYPWDHILRNEISANVTTSESSLSFPVSVSNYRKKSKLCLLVLMWLSDVRATFLEQISSLLTPVYIPITRKDEDHFVFVTQPHLIDELLLMKALPARIKYRLAIAADENKMVVKTACFFCAPGGQPKVIDWTRESAEGFRPDFEYFPDFVVNLNGRLLQIACPYIRAKIEVDPPYLGVNNAKRGIWKYALEEYLMPKFNFSYRMFAATDKDLKMGGGGTGLQLPNGTWTGVTGDLMAGRADIGVQTANTPKRIHYIDFTNSFFDVDHLTLVTTEGLRVYSPLAIFWPFDVLMWIGIVGSTAGAFLFFWLIIKTIQLLGLGDSDSLSFSRRGQIASGRQIWTLKYQIQFIITSFVDQDCVMPIFTPLRCFVSIWLFVTLVLTTVYRTKLVTLLAFPVLNTLPQTFDELAYSDYTVGFMKHGDSAYNTLAASTEPVYVKLIKEMEVIRSYGLECLVKVLQGKYGCIAYESAIRHQAERNLTEAEKRKLVVSPAHTYNVVFGISTEGKSIFRGNFGRWLSYTRPQHLQNIWDKMDMYHNVRKLKRSWWAEMNRTEEEEAGSQNQGGDENLTFKHISGAFVVLFILLGLAGIFFVLEAASYHRYSLRYQCVKYISLARETLCNNVILNAIKMLLTTKRKKKTRNYEGRDNLPVTKSGMTV